MNAPERFVGAEDRLHELAVAAAGCEDFGDPFYLDGLRRILAGYDEEARFHAAGRELAWQALVETLARRLRANRLLAGHEDGGNAARADTTGDAPLVITGLVRTGSTALHHVFGADPAWRALPYWLACHPRPEPPRERWADEPGYVAACDELEQMYAADPSLRSIHNMEAGAPEECRHFLAQSFTDDYFEVNTTMPSYVAWYETCRPVASYRHHRRLLELVCSAGKPAPWVLKYPVHLKHLDALFEVYPGARVVWTHRDPSVVLASYTSLIAGFRAVFEERIDREAIVREQTEVWAAATERALAVRDRVGDERFYDLDFAAFSADPVGSVAAIHAHIRPRVRRHFARGARGVVRRQPAGKARRAPLLHRRTGTRSWRRVGSLRSLQGTVRLGGRVGTRVVVVMRFDV